MSESLDEFVAEIDYLFPGHGLLRTHKQMNSGDESAGRPFAVFILATIYDLYGEESPEAINPQRIATAFELASYELARLAELLRRTERK